MSEQNSEAKSISRASDDAADPTIFGWYTSADATTPAHDPGRVPCPICGKPWDKNTVRTVCFMGMDADRSYFYRIHRACDTPQATQEIESRIIDGASHQH